MTTYARDQAYYAALYARSVALNPPVRVTETPAEKAARDDEKVFLALGPATWGVSFPRSSEWQWKFPTREAAAKFIERTYAPGRTSEPYVQLVEVRGDEGRVRAEWMPKGREWTSAAEAAAMASTVA